MKKERCKRCNRPLKAHSSVIKGYGYSCYKKHRKEAADAWFEKVQITIFEVVDFDE